MNERPSSPQDSSDRCSSGAAPEPPRRIPFRSGAVFSGMNHIYLANHPDVYEALREQLA